MTWRITLNPNGQSWDGVARAEDGRVHSIVGCASPDAARRALEAHIPAGEQVAVDPPMAFPAKLDRTRMAHRLAEALDTVVEVMPSTPQRDVIVRILSRETAALFAQGVAQIAGDPGAVVEDLYTEHALTANPADPTMGEPCDGDST